MNLAAHQSSDLGVSVDPGALGKTWTIENTDASPDVAEVIATMPWWATRGVLYVMVTFILVAVLWASVSHIDLVAEARGTVVPQGNVKSVQSAGSGLVQNVFVKEGDTVERGEPLVQLDASEMRTRVTKLRQELQTTQAQLNHMMVNAPMAETLEEQNRIARLQADIAAADAALQHTTIIAPVTGIITTMAVRGNGEVLQPGQTIATIAPSGVPLVVEAQVANKDIAFIEKGLPAKLKFDAFPFQDYGVVEGMVIDIAPDARVDQGSGSFYKVTIATGQSQFWKQKNVVLRPGLTVTAGIITERRTVLSLLLAPVRKFKKEIVQ
jgi:multidrug efflux pump subunit AcrA (membrane-fusion protein)